MHRCNSDSVYIR